jgi:hypothetical protein
MQISSLFVTPKKNKNQQNYFLTIKSAKRNFQQHRRKKNGITTNGLVVISDVIAV